MEAILGVRERVTTPTVIPERARQEASEVGRAAAPHPRTVRRRELPPGSSDASLSERRATRGTDSVHDEAEAGTAPSSVGQPGSGRRKAVWRNAGRSFSLGRGEVGGVDAVLSFG